MGIRTGELLWGIVQGRLVESPPGCVQWFPQERWREEFELATRAGLNYIELLAERDYNEDNPIWSAVGVEELKQLAQSHNLQLLSACDDYIIDHCLLGDAEVLEMCQTLLRRSHELGLSIYVLPLFEASNIDRQNYRSFVDDIRRIATWAEPFGITVCLETLLDADALVDLLSLVARENVAVVYDTGNHAGEGHDPAVEMVKLGRWVRHIHIKDKVDSGENVYLGTGLVDFAAVFAALARIDFSGGLTFESQRGMDPVRTARHNRRFAQFFAGETEGLAS